MDEGIFQQTVDENWGDTTSPKRVPLNDRNVSDAIKEALWPLPSEETNSEGSILDPITISGATMQFNLKIWKVGRTVFLTGYIQGDGNTFTNRNIIDIVSNGYRPLHDTVIHAFSPGGIYASLEVLEDGKIKVVNNSITSTNKYSINAMWAVKLSI